MTIRILITGATGFVGRHVLRSLIEHDILVTAVIRTGSEQRLEINQKIDRVFKSENIFSETTGWWEQVCENVDTLIHCAWYTEPGKFLQSSVNLDCLRGTLELAQGASRAKVRRFVGIGTCFEYDVSFGELSVETPLRPFTTYAGAKAAVYLALSQWFPTQLIDFTWCRLFYLFGEGEDGRRLVPYLRMQLSVGNVAELSSGNQIRDFMDVKEAGRIIVNVALSNHLGAVNVCSGVPVTIRQLAENIADEYDRRDLLRFGARHDNGMDPPKIVGILS
jgi:nucleoside-diphosphate-sugar epimerase